MEDGGDCMKLVILENRWKCPKTVLCAFHDVSFNTNEEQKRLPWLSLSWAGGKSGVREGCMPPSPPPSWRRRRESCVVGPLGPRSSPAG